GAAPTAKPVDAKAYPLILHAQALLDQQSKTGHEQAESLFKQALAVAPNEARAWAGLARVYFNQSTIGERPPAEGMQLAKDAAHKALDIDPGNVIALGALGRIAGDFEFDLPSAARHVQRALELEPGDLVALNAAAAVLTDFGRLDEVVRIYQ